MSFLDVKHQPFASRLIQRAVARDRVPHAYIFHGPDGVGKEMFARALAQYLLCEKRTIGGTDSTIRDSCGDCRECRAVRSDHHPDLYIVHRYLIREHPDPDVRKRKGLDISVDVLRHFLTDRVGLKPQRGRAKVFIVREADRITPQAQNALLKTLEEPPDDTFIVLLASALHFLLPTTQSRSQVLRFDPLPTEFIDTELSKLADKMPEEQVSWYARTAQGSLGWAVTAAQDDLYGLNTSVLTGLANLHVGGDATQRKARPMTKPGRDAGKVSALLQADVVAKAWLEDSASRADAFRKRDPDITETESTRCVLQTILHLAANWFSDVLHCAGDDSAPPVNAAWAEAIQRAAAQLGAERAADAVNRIVQAERQLDLNANPQLCVECLVNDLAA